MPENANPVEAALRGGSRAKNYASQIEKLCRRLPEDPQRIRGADAAELVKLAAACRASRAVTALLSPDERPAAATELVDFFDLFEVLYYPVMEDGKRSVGFWSVKDAATLTPEDVHEWVRDTKPNPKTGKPGAVAVGFGAWWKNHRPDYELYGVAGDRAEWRSKTVEVDGRKCVNTSYGKPPVLDRVPHGYDCDAAATVLDAVLERVITDPDPGNAARKRDRFVLDVGAHLLALRDGGDFRCRKLFCFTSTNGGQGTGKSLLQESIAALVPRDASVTVATTELAGQNLLQLYGASVCILTEAPSTATERYTAEDVKAFADAGWKTATEKYVAKRNVRDNSVKLLSSNHLAPLPIDSVRSRRVEFFVAADVDDGGSELRRYLDGVQQKRKWNDVALRQCVGWALLERAQNMLRRGLRPFATARRSIAARHLLSPIDYDYFVNKAGATDPSYNDYRDYRSDNGVSWSPDRYRFDDIVAMSRSAEIWVDDEEIPAPDPVPDPEDDGDTADDGDDVCSESVPEPEPASRPAAAKPLALQYKSRMATAYLENDRIGVAALYAYIVGDAGLKAATAAVRDGTADKRRVLRQVFPGAVFDRFSRTDNIVGFTGLTHVDFDKIAENGNGLTPAQVRDALAEMPGFVIGAVSSRGDGVWAIFNAGTAITDYQTYMAASRSLFDAVDERVCMRCDRALRLPTAGRTLGYDPDCRVADEALAGLLPPPYPWKAPTFAVAAVGKLAPTRQNGEATVDERVRNEKFLEAVVDNSCAKIQNAGNGERHDTAIKAVANVVMCCQERGVTPLASWGRRLRDACASCGLGRDETNSIMAYWRQRTGMSA